MPRKFSAELIIESPRDDIAREHVAAAITDLLKRANAYPPDRRFDWGGVLLSVEEVHGPTR